MTESHDSTSHSESPEQSGETMDIQALAAAFASFTKTTATLEEAYKRLEDRARTLDQELQARNRELAITTEYLNSIMDSMSDGVIVVDEEGRITTFNHAANQILGFEPGEVSGARFTDVFHREFQASAARQAVELRAKDGSLVPIHERTAPVEDRNRQRIGHVMVFQDLSEIESLRQQVRQKDRLAAIGEMAATVAHEIRNPLGGIRGFASLLERDIEPDDNRYRLVDKILTGTKTLDRIVNELLEYTRPVELRLKQLPCRDLVQRAIEEIDLGDTAATMSNNVDPALVCLGDDHMLRQVLVNVLLNAVQSMGDGGVVTITSDITDDIVRISLADTGSGILPEHLDHVFSPFFTTKEKGTGLGLAAAAKTIESHGGTITVESTPGNGATFHIELSKGVLP
jgi:PAS domain S-box-containing protein